MRQSRIDSIEARHQGDVRSSTRLSQLERQQHLLVVASAKGDGIRAGGRVASAQDLLSDEIDKYSDGFYANAGWLARLLPRHDPSGRPMIRSRRSRSIDGCDAHNFDDLRKGLGKHVRPKARSTATSPGSRPTLATTVSLQTLIEPGERVAIQAAEPDQKEPYKLISKVKFSGPTTSRRRSVFNRNLNAIIGSRSSGKSALLAFIAHAVDPVETVRIQAETAGLRDQSDAGPAAGFTWVTSLASPARSSGSRAGAPPAGHLHPAELALHAQRAA